MIRAISDDGPARAGRVASTRDAARDGDRFGDGGREWGGIPPLRRESVRAVRYVGEHDQASFRHRVHERWCFVFSDRWRPGSVRAVQVGPGVRAGSAGAGESGCGAGTAEPRVAEAAGRGHRAAPELPQPARFAAHRRGHCGRIARCQRRCHGDAAALAIRGVGRRPARLVLECLDLRPAPWLAGRVGVDPAPRIGRLGRAAKPNTVRRAEPPRPARQGRGEAERRDERAQQHPVRRARCRLPAR